MPLQSQKTYVPATPTHVYAKSLTLTGVVIGGQLRVSANIILRGASVSVQGVWTDAVVESRPVNIADVYNLPEKYADLADDFVAANAAIVNLIDKINAKDKVL